MIFAEIPHSLERGRFVVFDDRMRGSVKSQKCWLMVSGSLLIC
jgi:hypothetical protein